MSAPWTRPHFIGGQWHSGAAGGATVDVYNASNEELVARLPAAGEQHVQMAVAAASNALEMTDWSSTSGAARAKFLRVIAQGVLQAKEKLARLDSLMGKPLSEAMWDMDDVAACFDYYAEQAVKLDERQGTPVALPDGDYAGELRYAAVGVVAAIVPWNYPLLMAAWKVAPALAAGCAVILKPSELSPLSAMELAVIVSAAGVPAGIFNVLIGAGRVGAALSSHARVDKVAFTGSVPTGAAVMRAAAESVTNVSLELGGKSAIIVFDDVDIDTAVEWVMFGAFWTNGQICSATSRLLVHSSIADRLLARLKECAASIPLCDPLAPEHAEATGTLGPLISAAQRDKVAAMVSAAVSEGATLLTGGKRPASKPKGYWYEPTVLCVEPEKHSIWRTEVFGPVLACATFSTEAEAIRLANGTDFGLAAAVLSRDEARARRIGARVQAGIVWINCSQPCFVQLPWGGVKRSGIGRELGEQGLYAYLEVKQVCTYKSLNPLGWYKLPKSKL